MRQEFSALIFGPGLPPGGSNGTLTVSASGVEVSVRSVANADLQFQSARFNELTLREVGFGAPGVELAWTESGGVWAAHILDSAAARRLLAMPEFASAQASALKSQQRSNRVGRTLGLSLLVLFVLLPVIFLALLLLNSNRIAGWIADKIPIEQEVSLGKQAFSGMRGQLQLRDSGPVYDAAQSIVAQLTKGSRYHYEVHVTQDDTLNAFAMPGGIIVIHTGLIAATKRPEELAGVLAHEIQHVEQRHSVRGMVKDLGLRGLWSAVTGDIGATLAGQAALEMTSLKFSRDDETEADYKGFDALVAAGIDPVGMPAFFKTMGEKSADAPAAFLSTHPLSVDRQKDLQQRVDNLPRQDFNALNFGAWPPPSLFPTH
jgi:Zn-dependent protease with chaperone function